MFSHISIVWTFLLKSVAKVSMDKQQELVEIIGYSGHIF
jgi:hypothetical protein